MCVRQHSEKKYVVKDSLKFSDTDAVVSKFIVDKSRYLILLKKKKRYAVDLYPCCGFISRQ